MFLSNFSVRRPVATVVIILGLMALGLLALSKLKVNERPDVALPLLVVNIPYPGASPETVERELLNRVEKSFQSVTGVREVRSAANEGGASLQVFFEFGKDLVEGADEVRNALGSVRYKLPTEIREPVIVRIDPSAQPIMQVAVSSSSQTHAVISRLVEDQLADRFRALSGVAQVNVYGALRRELSVLLQAQKMRELNVTVNEVINALRQQNAAAPVGKVRGTLEDQSSSFSMGRRVCRSTRSPPAPIIPAITRSKLAAPASSSSRCALSPVSRWGPRRPPCRGR